MEFFKKTVGKVYASEKGFAHIFLIFAIGVVVVFASAALWAGYKNGHLSTKPGQFNNKQGG